MENLSFLLKLCLHVRASMEGGESLRVSLMRFCDKRTSLAQIRLSEWLNHFDHTAGEDRSEFYFSHTQTQMFLEILSQGLRGHAIYERVCSFEEELIELCKEEFQKELDRLPYILMVPLLLFMFPAYLILLLGPILNLFIQSI